jgi:hypothetical protein
MARVLEVDAQGKEIRKSLGRSFQSGQINFLIGSGASTPAIPSAGAIESAIATLFANGEEAAARARMYDFLSRIQVPTNKLIGNQPDNDNAATLALYEQYLNTIEIILAERRTTLLPKQATIFTTNYDLFIEHASSRLKALKLNDGFNRTPNLDGRSQYSSRTFFNATYNTGNLYNYKVEIPCVNLVKLHGSLSWAKDNDEILFRVAAAPLLPADRTDAQIQAHIDACAVVLPQLAKFRTTLMDRTYYELLRIYANELDRENTLLVAFGFSFVDEHILDITKRALKNPTLRLVVFAFDTAALTSFQTKFEGYNNVDIIKTPDGSTLGFAKFNEVMRSLLPKTADET